MAKQAKTVWVTTYPGEKLGISGEFVTGIHSTQAQADATGDGYMSAVEGQYAIGQFLADDAPTQRPLPSMRETLAFIGGSY